MDKKNTLFGVLLLLAAFAAMYLSRPPANSAKPVAATPASVPAGNGTTPATTAPTNAVAPAPAPASTNSSAIYADAVKYSDSATVTKLSNEFVEVHFTDAGGAIREVALKKYPAVLGKPEPLVFNQLHADPMLGFVDYAGLDHNTSFELVKRTDTEVVYRARLPNLEVERHYTLSTGSEKDSDPYQIKHETIFRNTGDAPLNAFRVAIALGTAAPAHANDNGFQITTAYLDAKNDFHQHQRAELDASGGFIGMGAHPARSSIQSAGPIQWAGVKNQFFTTILTPDEPGSGVIARRVKLFPEMPNEAPNAYGITGAAQFDIKGIAAHSETRFAAKFYVGPKEYRRLANTDAFKLKQEKMMGFGFWSLFSQLMNRMMTWFHDLIAAPNSLRQWGIAIILTTLTLKIVTLPLTIKAARSMKRMQKLGPELKVIREKYKDNLQKKQAAELELFKLHKINPLGGCIPMLLPMPFFFGFYAMLSSTAELRFAPFLWAHDLSMPDTVGYLFGFPINILPLLLAATTIVQMNLTPQTNLDKSQAMMMKITPLIFLVICYNFSCALSLYSTINGLFTIGQQIIINRMKDDGDPVKTPAATATASPFGKRMKNVTPKKG